jgi:hypothetical protein
MAEKLTTYDPAEDLASDEAMATFMAAAFETNDASYIARAWRRRSREGHGANSLTNRPFPRAALPLLQRERQPDSKNHACRDESTWPRSNRQGSRLTATKY